MTTQDEQVFPYYRSPGAIRDQQFAHRVRGLDEEEVYEYLDLLADQVQATELERVETRAELQRLRADNERLRAENERLRSQPAEPLEVHRPANQDAVTLFSQAQQVADQVVEEAVRHARDLLAAARAEQREILQRARQTADATPRAAAWGQAANGYAAVVPDADFVRSTQVAQVQLRVLVQALAEQVERLGSNLPGVLPAGSVTVSGDDQLPVARPSSWPYDGPRYP